MEANSKSPPNAHLTLYRDIDISFRPKSNVNYILYKWFFHPHDIDPLSAQFPVSSKDSDLAKPHLAIQPLPCLIEGERSQHQFVKAVFHRINLQVAKKRLSHSLSPPSPLHIHRELTHASIRTSMRIGMQVCPADDIRIPRRRQRPDIGGCVEKTMCRYTPYPWDPAPTS